MGDATKRKRGAAAGAWALVGLALLGACAPEADGAAEDIEVVTGALRFAIGAMDASEGSRLLTHAPKATTACFLTGAAGTLRNPSAGVQRLNVSSTADATFWTLRATQETNSKSMGYLCVQGLSANGYTTHTWSATAANPAPVDMGPTSDRVCFLNKIEGWFNGLGEMVRVRRFSGRWLLDGTMGTLHEYKIAAGATCILGVTSAEYSVEYPVTSPVDGRAFVVTPYPAPAGNDGHVCGLSMISGKFDGFPNTESVGVSISTSGWIVAARGDGNAVSTAGRCVDRFALP